MNVTRENLPKSQVKLTITVDADEFEKFKKKAFQKLSSEVSMPGFRKGHVPEKMLRERYGEEMIVAEAADMAIPRMLAEAVAQEKLLLIGRPEVSLETVNPFAFTAIITILPEVKLGKWRDAKIPEPNITIDHEEIESVVKSLQERFQTRKAVDREAQDEDFVEIDFTGTTLDGVPLDGASSRMHPLILGSETFIPGFEAEIKGLKKGEEKDFTITFPADYHAKHLASKDVRFHIKLHSVFEHEKPQIDEAFTEQIFGRKMSIPEFEAEIEKILREKKTGDERERREGELVTLWSEQAAVELPDLLVDEELDRLRHGIKAQAERAQVEWEQFLVNMKKTEEDFEKEMRPVAAENVKKRLVIQAIVREADINIPAAEIDAMIAEHNESSGHHHSAHDHDYRQETEARLKIGKLFNIFLGEETPSAEKNSDKPADQKSADIENEEAESANTGNFEKG